MGNYDKNIHSRDHDPYENIRIPPTDKDKKKRDEHALQDSAKSKIFATLATYFKKIASLFTSKERETPAHLSQPQLLKNLIAFRVELEILAKQDQSHQPAFTEKLTQLWHKLSDDCNCIWDTQDFSSSFKSALKFLLSQISEYPLGADHTLGYYFNASAGREWIPFPFMELLSALHQEYQQNPQASHLTTWLLLIDAILRMV